MKKSFLGGGLKMLNTRSRNMALFLLVLSFYFEFTEMQEQYF